MRSILRAFRWFVAMTVVAATSVVPACGTMGGGGMGGGMHYLTDPAPASAEAAT